MNIKRYYVFFALLTVVSAAAIAAQTMVSGPIKADRALSDRIRNTNDQIQMYTSSGEAAAMLPENLDALEGSHEGITYTRLDFKTYELCGTFQTANKAPSSMRERPSGYYIDPTYHPKGYHCFKGVLQGAEAKPRPL